MPLPPPRLDRPADRPAGRPAPERVRDSYLGPDGARTRAPDIASDIAAAGLPAADRRRRAGWLLALVLVPLALATAVGLFLLWPSGGANAAAQAARAAVPAGLSHPSGRVASVTPYDCSAPGSDGTAHRLTCGTAVVEVTEGEDSGTFQQVDLPAPVVALGVHRGDTLVLTRDPGAENGTTYAFRDFARGTPLLVLALAFVLVVAAVARARGLLALAGLGVSFAVLLEFLLPGLLRGEPAAAVTMVGSAAILAVLLPTRGFSVRTLTALAGSAGGLAVAAALGAVADGAARIGGAAAQGTPLPSWDPSLDLSGLSVAAVAVAGLGLLASVTWGQAATVWRLVEKDPSAGRRELVRRGLTAARERAGSIVAAMVLAYAGAALPLLLVLEVSAEPLWQQLTGAATADFLVRTLAGGIAVVLAIPVTTAVGVLAATFAGTEAGAVPDRRMAALRARFGR